ncbi:hypothetical protein APHAL10511_004029 [Amanita phalloides]|nr:hypothetical protein APHAL10511_004029 [Amanita phalloides]
MHSLVVKKIRPSRWLPVIMKMWGILMMVTGFVKNYRELLCLRLLLGSAEGGLIPGIIYYLTLWYPRGRLQTRLVIFLGWLTLVNVIPVLIVYAPGTRGYLRWSWILILEGAAAVVVGIIGLLVTVDLFADAEFLTPQERAFVIHQHSA